MSDHPTQPPTEPTPDQTTGGSQNTPPLDDRPTEAELPQSFFRFTVTRPVAITMVVLAAAVFGLVGLARLPVNLLPDISYPTVTVRTEYPGASPRDVEERVSERIQESVSVVSGVKRVLSISRPGVSDVILEMAWGTEMVFAVSEVRERLDRVYPPEDAKRPLVLRYDPSLDPVLTLGITVAGGEELAPEVERKRLIELRRLAELDLEEGISQVDGVAAVKIRGGDEEEIRIAVDEAALTALNLDISTIGSRLAAENLNAASGSIEEGKTEFLVRALNEYRTLEEIESTILVRRGDASVRIRDVAKVLRTPADRQVIARIGDRPCVLVEVQKEAGANVVALCASVRERVFGSEAQRGYVARGAAEQPLITDDSQSKTEIASARAQRRAMTNYLAYQLQPLGMELELLQDQSTFVKRSVDDVLDSALLGGLFAILVIFLFLRRAAPTLVLAVSIPLSLVATFAPMFMSGVDLNIMSLGGLALGVGMLVDNSIVVLESIAKMREEGNSIAASAVLGVSRVASAVVASTLTTVAVFFPIVFVEGVAGQLFRDQALTVVFALLMSLLVALFVIPMLAGGAGRSVRSTRVGDGFEGEGDGAPQPLLATRPVRKPGLHGLLLWPFAWVAWTVQTLMRGAARAITWLATGALRVLLIAGRAFATVFRAVTRPLLAGFHWLYSAVEGVYPKLLATALRVRYAVLLIAGAALFLAVDRMSSLGTELLPQVHQREFWVEGFLPRDATVERTDATLRGIQTSVAALPDVERTFLASGVDEDELNDSDEGQHSSKLLVTLGPPGAQESRAKQVERVQSVIREIYFREPDLEEPRFPEPSAISFTAPLVVEVLGNDLLALRRACQRIVGELEKVESLQDVRSTLQRGNPEVSIRYDRDKLAGLGLDAQTITRILKAKVLGDVPTTFAERERKIDMRVRVDRSELDSVERLLAINVNPNGYPEIPLSEVAAVKLVEGPSEIRRLGNNRGAEVHAEVVGFDLGTTQLLVDDMLAGLTMPRGIDTRLGGQKEDLEESQQSLTMALLLAVFLVYVVMASQFESLVQPLVILASIPLALVGVVIALDLLSINVSVIVFLGAIVLAGIVVNNAIILIDQINRLRQAGLAKFEAIVQGSKSRLRPVLMTTLTTVLGLLPLTGWLAGLPLIGGTGEGLELRAPMAVTVIAGLLSSTLLTLIVVPVVYSVSDRRA